MHLMCLVMVYTTHAVSFRRTLATHLHSITLDRQLFFVLSGSDVVGPNLVKGEIK